MRVKNLDKKIDEEEPIVMPFTRELKWEKKNTERLDCEKKVKGQTTEELLPGTVRVANISWRCVDRLSKALEPQYISLAMSVT